MPITTNETHSSGSSDLSKGDLAKGADSGRAGGASGVEVPVVVHASRYSSSANSVGKSLPPVHEETRTVIVFENGAVVRLSAVVTTGEVVVLTNKVTGADVICKVGNVKAQPGIQNYVSLEFTQRAPGFWGESSQAPRAPQAPPVEATPAPIAAPTLTSRPAEPAPPAKPSSVATISTESVPARPQVLPPAPPAPPVASYEHQAIAPEIAESISSPPAVPAFPANSSKVFEAGSTLGLRQSSPASVSQRPIELAVPSQGPGRGGKNIALMAVAAVVLVLAGGVGAWLLLRPSRSAAPRSEAAGASPQTPSASSGAPSQPEKSAAPDASLSASAQAEPEVTPSAAALRSDLRPAPRAETHAIQPAVAKSASASPAATSTSAASASPIATQTASPTETSHRAVLDVGKMATPSAKRKTPASSTSSEAPPELLSQSQPLPGGSLNDGLLIASARNAGPSSPSPSAPANGGHLVQPKLISSPAALYPTEAREAHIQGDVAVDAFIDEKGKVAATKVISGPPVLQQAAINAVRSWRYQPARLDDQPISIHIRVDVNFQIQ